MISGIAADSQGCRKTRAVEGIRAAIIMPVFNGAEHISRSLRLALDTSPPDCQIIAIDNGSTDNSYAILHRILHRSSMQDPDRLHTISNEQNLGFPAACNQGIRLALKRGAKYVVLLNQDAFPQPGWIDALVNAAELDPTYGAVQALVLLESDTAQPLINTAGNPMHYLGFSWCGSYGEIAPPAGTSIVHEISVGSGAALLLTRKALEDIGLLDESFFLYHEDADLCWRMRLAGYKIGIATSARVTHEYSPSAAAAKFCYAERNRWALLLKTASIQRLVLTAPMLLATAAAALMVANKGHITREYLRSMWSIIKGRRSILASRRHIQANRRVRERDLLPWLTSEIETQGLLPSTAQAFANKVMRGYWNIAYRLI